MKQCTRFLTGASCNSPVICRKPWEKALADDTTSSDVRAYITMFSIPKQGEPPAFTHFRGFSVPPPRCQLAASRYRPNPTFLTLRRSASLLLTAFVTSFACDLKPALTTLWLISRGLIGFVV